MLEKWCLTFSQKKGGVNCVAFKTIDVDPFELAASSTPTNVKKREMR